MKKKIYLTRLIVAGFCLLLGLSWLLDAGYVSAQEPEPRPTLPADSGDGGGNDGDGGSGDRRGNGDHDTAPVPRTGRISGFVYGYSDYAYVSGVKVVIDGGGWQAETLTDSSGFYQFTGLGAGRGVINLKLPPGAHPVVFDWPVQVGGGSDLQVNLGYYWQQPSALPVLVSGQVVDQVLDLTVKNQTTGVIKGSVLELTAPVDQQLSPSVTANQGEIADYGPYRMRFALGTLEPAATINVAVPLEKISTLSVDPNEAHIRVAFSYDQQKTPLLVNIRSDKAESTAAALPQITATALPNPSSPMLAAPPAPTSIRPIAPLPVTGNPQSSTGPAELILPILLLLGLGWAGWYALKTGRTTSKTGGKNE